MTEQEMTKREEITVPCLFNPKKNCPERCKLNALIKQVLIVSGSKDVLPPTAINPALKCECKRFEV